jgi:hypothetical protein
MEKWNDGKMDVEHYENGHRETGFKGLELIYLILMKNYKMSEPPSNRGRL